MRSDLERELQSVGRPLETFRSILDFGCGSGRTMLHMSDLASRARLHGTDIDEAAILWCQRHLTYARFSVNPASPPSVYGDGSFDLIYALSVFTHLPEDLQFAWLGELRRISTPEAIVLVTLHGRSIWQGRPQDQVDALRTNGFLYISNDYWRGVYPDWYQASYHTREYVEREYGRLFEIVRYSEGGLNADQDVVVMRRP